jgi:hypothetical protein
MTLVENEVLVGVPDDTTDRRDDDTPLTNAALAYIHDNGMPEQNIPARPFMIPGMTEAESDVADQLAGAACAALRAQGPGEVEKRQHRAGAVAVTAIKRKLNEGIPPPLKDSTLRDRLRRHPDRFGESWELAWRGAGAPAGTELAKPLIDTGEMRNSIKYVIRARKKRK